MLRAYNFLQRWVNKGFPILRPVIAPESWQLSFSEAEDLGRQWRVSPCSPVPWPWAAPLRSFLTTDSKGVWFHFPDRGILLVWFKVTATLSWLAQFPCTCVDSSPSQPHARMSGNTDSFQRPGGRLQARSCSRTNHKWFLSLSAPSSPSKCKACTTAVNVRDRPVPRAKESNHQYSENIMVPAILSSRNQEQWIHLAINNFISKANICACNLIRCSLRINCLTK